MKKNVIKGIVCVITFFLSLFIVSKVMNQGNTDMTVEMGKATFPLIYMNQSADHLNCLHGYIEEMDGSTMRDCITPLDSERSLSILIQKMGCKVDKLSFEVRSIDGKRLVEATDITDYTEEADMLSATFTVKDLIEENEEYNLIILLEDEEGRIIRYYTRMIRAPKYYAAEKLAFVKDFHERTFDKEKAKALTKYLESNADGDNTTFSHVNIHSSFQQITWGELPVTRANEPVYSLKEIGPSTANVEVKYMVMIPEGKKENMYFVTEYYRIRYTEQRVYLLNFERDMSQVFEPDEDAFMNSKISLGINDTDLSLKESDGGNALTFINENQLYSYNISDNKFAYLFGFCDKENNDERTQYQAHGIKILSVDETGNVQFLVYGYMNRGRHEGEMGIQVYYYNSMLNTIEEEVFIPDSRSFDRVKADVERMSYLNNNSYLYLMMSNSVYEVDLESKTCKEIISSLKEDDYRISNSNRMIAWKNKDVKNTELVLMNLSNKKQTRIHASAEEQIVPLGFMGEDFIYGVSRKDEIEKDASGKVIVPMYKVLIQDENDKVLKNYMQEGIYIISAEIDENQITLKRASKNEETMQYEAISDDQIMNNEETAAGMNTVESVVTEEYESVVQIALKNSVEKKKIKFLTPKEVLFEGGREIRITSEESAMPCYYVYGLRGIDGIYTDAGNAINRAEQISGTVVNEKGDYLWIAGNRNLKNQIMKIKEASVDETRGSLAVCLEVILDFEGMARNTAYMLEQGMTAVQVLEKSLPDVRVLELSGCSLDSVLYYVNRDIPVLASLNDGNAVLIIGFNELNTVLMDPSSGTIYKMGMNDSKQLFEENGNSFLTYTRN